MMRRTRDRRRPEALTQPCYTHTLTSADNVANYLAKKLYQDHGVTSVEPAMECQMAEKITTDGLEVMHTRYCLRRELGACLKSKDANKLPARLFLRTGNHLISIYCDCTNCEMHLTRVD